MLTAIVTVLSTAAPAIASPSPTKHLGRDVTSPGASPISIGDDGTAASRETAGPFGPSQLKMLYDSGPIESYYNGDLDYEEPRIGDLNGDGHEDLLYFTYYNGWDRDISMSALDLVGGRVLWSNNWSLSSRHNSIYTNFDFDANGVKEILVIDPEYIYVINGNNGSEAWRYPCNGSGRSFGDVDGDGELEVIVSNEGFGKDFYITSLDGTSGVVEWVSGPINGAYDVDTGELDGDGHEEIIIGWDVEGKHFDFGIVVIDAVSNTTEWSKTYTEPAYFRLANVNGTDGRDNVLVEEGEWRAKLHIYGTGGNELRICNISGTLVSLSGWYLMNTDTDAALEIVSHEDRHNAKIIDGATGVTQGEFTCTTYEIYYFWPLEGDSKAGTDFYYINTSGDTTYLTILSGVNLSFKYEYTFPASETWDWDNWYLDRKDIDGNGDDELIVDTNSSFYVFNYTSTELKWVDKSANNTDYIAMGLVLGEGSKTSKVMDLIAISRSAPHWQDYNIVFYNSQDGSKVTSTETYYEIADLFVSDVDGDGLDEMVILEGYNGPNRIYYLKASFPPKISGTIPTLQVPEDGSTPNALNLSTIVLDDGLDGPLTFAVVPSSGTTYLTGTINGTWLDLTASVRDWNGNTTIDISANDGVNPPITGTIPVTVFPVNDPPEAMLLSPINGSEIEQLDPTFEWGVTDVDGDAVTSDMYYGTNLDAVRGLDQSAKMAVSLTSPSFVPATPLRDGTTYYWTVVPRDGNISGKCTSGIWIFKVKEGATVNHPPTIVPIPRQEAIVGQQFELKVQGQDIDPGDASRFNFGLMDAPAGVTIDQDTGLISWIPTESHVGDHTITVTMTDGKATVNTTFDIEVKAEGDGDNDGWTGTEISANYQPLLLFFVMLVIIAGAILIIRTKRKDKGEARVAPRRVKPQDRSHRKKTRHRSNRPPSTRGKTPSQGHPRQRHPNHR